MPLCSASTRFVQLLAVAQIAGTLALVGAALVRSTSATASITGVCPDGSIYVVQRPEAIPCSRSKQVEPHDLPPLKPGNLPRPYGWERFQRRQDRNNPYNLVDEAPTLRLPEGSRPAEPPPPVRPGRALAPQPAETRARQPDAPALDFAEAELRDLARIVELLQRRTAATFEPREAGGVTLRLARSTAFEPRLRELWDARGGLGPGPVVLFSAIASPDGPARFHANLTFVQGHNAFHPDPSNPRELGVLRGRLGAMGPGASVLGYAVLPQEIDLSRPLDIYWNDRLLTVTMAPAAPARALGAGS